jgi:hypothetical protein
MVFLAMEFLATAPSGRAFGDEDFGGQFNLKPYARSYEMREGKDLTSGRRRNHVCATVQREEVDARPY